MTVAERPIKPVSLLAFFDRSSVESHQIGSPRSEVHVPLSPTLVIADAHGLFAAGLSKLLSPKFKILSTVADGRSLVDATSRVHPDLVLA